MMTVIDRFRHAFSSPGPTAALDISATHVTGVTVGWEKGEPRLTGCVQAPLPAGAITPTPTDENVHDAETVSQTIRQVIDRLPGRPNRGGLTIPDPVAKVSFVALDEIPRRTGDLERLLAWQVRKAAPFRVEDAQLAFTVGRPRGTHGREFVVTLVRRDVVTRYEAVCETAGIHAGVVDLASFNVMNAVLGQSPPPDSDWLLLHYAPGYCTLAILRGRYLIFFRNRPAPVEATLADVVHQTAMYYEDHLADTRHARPGLQRAVVVDTSSPARTDTTPDPLDPGWIASLLVDRLQTRVDHVTIRSLLGSAADRFPDAPARGLASVGLLLRDRATAA